MITRRARRWWIAAAGAGLVVLLVVVTLPVVVRHLAVRRVAAMTGRPVSSLTSTSTCSPAASCSTA